MIHLDTTYTMEKMLIQTFLMNTIEIEIKFQDASEILIKKKMTHVRKRKIYKKQKVDGFVLKLF